MKPYIDLPLDAHRLTKVISYLLTREDIPHSTCIGAVQAEEDGEFVIHSWIRLLTGEIVDFRPPDGLQEHPSPGIFHPDALPLIYDGTEVDLSVSPVLFDVLTRRSPGRDQAS